jgi:ribosomal-protein-alanine N-acetyltransferase
VGIRHFLPEDLAAVADLVNETFHQLFSPEMYVALHRAWPEGQLLFIEGGRLVGVLLSIKRSATVGRVLVMAVPVDQRGRGIGTQLLNEFLSQCAREFMMSAVLEVRISNQRAQEFYSRFGFRRVEPLAGYYPDGEDGILMVRDLV